MYAASHMSYRFAAADTASAEFKPKAISYVLIKAKYKPARCNGQPCAMEFPFRFNLTV